jgi:hypothetical protein
MQFLQEQGRIKANYFKLKEKQKANQKGPNKEPNVAELESGNVILCQMEKTSLRSIG